MTASSYLNASDSALSHTISGNDRPHHLVVSGVWEIPFGQGRLLAKSLPRVLDLVFGGWQLQGVYSAQSGAPLSWGKSSSRATFTTSRSPPGHRNIQRWFNINAGVEKKSSKQLGSNLCTFPTMLAGVRAPGTQCVSGSLFKDFRIQDDL